MTDSTLRERIEALRQPHHRFCNLTLRPPVERPADVECNCGALAANETLDAVLALVSAEGEHPDTAPADWMERARKLCEHHHPYVTLKPCDSCKAIASAHRKPDAARAARGGEPK